MDRNASHPAEGRIRLTVAGTRSGVGKTSLLVRLAPALPGRWGAIKLSVHEDGRHGPPGVLDAPSEILEPGTDTARLANAGYDPVLWVRATPSTLADSWREATARGDRAWAVEGGAHTRIARSERVVLVHAAGVVKPGLGPIAQRADLCVVTTAAGTTEPAPGKDDGTLAGCRDVVRVDFDDDRDERTRATVLRIATWFRP